MSAIQPDFNMWKSLYDIKPIPMLHKLIQPYYYFWIFLVCPQWTCKLNFLQLNQYSNIPPEKAQQTILYESDSRSPSYLWGLNY